MMKGSIADVVCLFLYGSKESCNAYAQLRTFFNLFMRIGMPQSQDIWQAVKKTASVKTALFAFTCYVFTRICMVSMQDFLYAF